MPTELKKRIRQEAELTQRFAACYRQQFDVLIERLNHHPGDEGSAIHAQCLRLCVEALSMMLSTQDRMARALNQLGSASSPAAEPAAPRQRPASPLAAVS